MLGFATCHPMVNFIYFVLVIGCSMVFMHPLCIGISLVCAFLYSVMCKGGRAAYINLCYMLPVFLLSAVVNPLFNHGGATVLTYFPNGNPLTAESILYGLCGGGMLVCVICWFSCYNAVMTSDKFICLFGRVIPALSLVFSMTLRFVPKFIRQIKEVAAAQKGLGRKVGTGGVIKRAKQGLHILSVMITWALEDAVETADSMKARGYGLAGRSSFTIFRFDVRDTVFTIYILFTGCYTIVGSCLGQTAWSFFPTVQSAPCTLYEISVFLSYFLLCITPVVTDYREARKWKAFN